MDVRQDSHAGGGVQIELSEDHNSHYRRSPVLNVFNIMPSENSGLMPY